jgi:hypothetical protein
MGTEYYSCYATEDGAQPSELRVVDCKVGT